VREIEDFIRLIWQFLEEFFEAVQQEKSRRYASLNAKRLLGYPVKSLNIGTALIWTAYGRGRESTNNLLRDLVLALAGVYSGQLRGWFGWKRRIFSPPFIRKVRFLTAPKPNKAWRT
jgi:hypothetical protein